MASSWADISKSIASLQALCDQGKSGALNRDGEQIQLRQMSDQVRKLQWQLQDPSQMVIEYCSYANAVAIISTAMSMGIFDNVPTSSSIMVEDLAHKCKAESTLVLRIMHVLTSVGIFEEVEVRQWRHNKFSSYFSHHDSPVGPAVFTLVGVDVVPTMMKLADFLARHRWKDPSNVTEHLFAFHHNQPDKTFWDVLETTPERIDIWNRAMQFFSAHDPLTDLFPFVEKLKHKNTRDRVLAVDVGGGRGSAMTEIRNRCPELEGELILQDRAVVINQLTDADLPGVSRTVHDFFEVQPVKGAQVYLIKRVLHDWPNEDASRILKAIKPSMAKDSRILVWDITITEPVTPAQGLSVWYDSIMMVVGGRERCEADWQNLAEVSGLRLAHIWQDQARFGGFSIVEYLLPESSED